jgi:hypothetical protein
MNATKRSPFADAVDEEFEIVAQTGLDISRSVWRSGGKSDITVVASRVEQF